MILVAGGTGRLGREVTRRLAASGHRVRVLTRHPDPANDIGVEARTGDLRDPSSLRAATRGVTAVVSAAHGFLGGRGAGPREVDDQGNANLIRSAVEAGVEHVVLLSVLGARPNHPMSLHRAKHAAEEHLRASGLSWTVLRPSSYVETWIDVVGAKVRSGGPAVVFGRADNPINFISVHDVATLVERALGDASLRGQLLDVPGPENLTMAQLATALGAGTIRHIPRGALRVLGTLLPPVAPAFARQARAALVMDTTDMTADASALHRRFPDIVWHPPTQAAQQFRTDAGHLGAG